MKIMGVIPARYASTRFPGKPLVLIGGVSMVMRTYLQACKAEALADVVVATDDARIYNHVTENGGKAVMTSPSHPTGTDRILELAENFPEMDAFINIQGDEPFIEPEQINQVCAALGMGEEAKVGTLVKRMEDLSHLYNPNVIKVVRRDDGQALYFSRSPIPFNRQTAFEWGRVTPEMENWHAQFGYFRHIGIYGYTRMALEIIRTLKMGSMELSESLEQLRWMQAGIPIQTLITQFENFGIDAPEDQERAEKMLAERAKKGN